MMELELGGFDGNYTLEENIRQFFHVWVEGTKRIATCQHFGVSFGCGSMSAKSLTCSQSPDLHPTKDIGRLRAEGGLEKEGLCRFERSKKLPLAFWIFWIRYWFCVNFYCFLLISIIRASYCRANVSHNSRRDFGCWGGCWISQQLSRYRHANKVLITAPYGTQRLDRLDHGLVGIWPTPTWSLVDLWGPASLRRSSDSSNFAREHLVVDGPPRDAEFPTLLVH